MPEQLSGLIGMNWNLNAGGYVARQIYGTADDEGTSEDNSYLSKLKNGNIKDKDIIWENSVGYANADIDAPDVFSFSVNGISGSFFIDNSGEIKIISNDAVNVDLSNFKHQKVDASGYMLPEEVHTNGNSHINSFIKIIDKNGYSYIFGGVSREKSIRLRRYPDGSRTTGAMDFWYLSKIIAPNGREMVFDYYEGTWWIYGFSSGFAIQNIYLNKNCNCEQPTLYDSTYCFKRGNYLMTTNTRIEDVVLKRIKIDDIGFSMNFNCVFQTDSLGNNDNVGDEVKKWRERNILSTTRLNSIDLKIGDETQRFTFHRESVECNDNKSVFLKGVTTFTGTKYAFDYNLNSECLRTDSTLNPPNWTFPYSHWYEWYLKDNYGYFKSNPFYGILTSITLPTGGTQHYIYEKHHYSKLKMLAIDDTWEPEIIFENATRQDLYNNIRIKKIETKDENSDLVETKEYSYNNFEFVSGQESDYLPNIQYAPTNNPNSSGYSGYSSGLNSSSGTLNCDFAIKNVGNAAKPYFVFDRAGVKNPEPLAVTYSRVKEKITLSSGKIFENIYKFHDYNEIPDYIMFKTNTAQKDGENTEKYNVQVPLEKL